jgi:hypothetical protein
MSKLEFLRISTYNIYPYHPLLRCTTLCYAALRCATLHYAVLRCTTLILHCIAIPPAALRLANYPPARQLPSGSPAITILQR